MFAPSRKPAARSLCSFLALSLPLLGCSSDLDTHAEGGDGGGGAGGDVTTMTTGVGGQGGAGGSSSSGDASNTCRNAIALDMNGSEQIGGDAINPVGDRDFHLVLLEEGQWYWIRVHSEEGFDPDFDPVARLYEPKGTLMATADDAFPWTNGWRSYMVVRAEASGYHCLEVLTYDDWMGEPTTGGPELTYSVDASPVDGVEEAGAMDAEPNDSAPGQSVSSTGAVGRPVLGGLDTSSDVDWFAFTAGSEWLTVDIAPSGAGTAGQSGHGSTTPPATVSLWNANATTLLAELDTFTHLPHGLRGMTGVPVSTGETYLLQVSRSLGVEGVNDFYAMRLVDEPTEGVEASDILNDDPTTPEVISTTGYIRARLPEGDVDHWTTHFETEVGARFGVRCRAWAAGSSVRSLNVTLATIDEAGVVTPLRTEVEDPALGVWWADREFAGDTMVVLPNDDPILLILENQGNDDDGSVSSAHYHCKVDYTAP